MTNMPTFQCREDKNVDISVEAVDNDTLERRRLEHKTKGGEAPAIADLLTHPQQ
jgi:stalled ribosome alternative rescue factor ArfA